MAKSSFTDPDPRPLAEHGRGAWLYGDVAGALRKVLYYFVATLLLVGSALIAAFWFAPNSGLVRHVDPIMSEAPWPFGPLWKEIVPRPADTQPSHLLAGTGSQLLPPWSSLVSIDPNSSLDTHYRAFLTQTLRKRGLQVTDDPAQADIVFNVSLDVSPPHSGSVGTTVIWRATAGATLRASARNGVGQIFSGKGGGDGRGMQPDSAANEAAEAAIDHAVEDYLTSRMK